MANVVAFLYKQNDTYGQNSVLGRVNRYEMRVSDKSIREIVEDAEAITKPNETMTYIGLRDTGFHSTESYAEMLQRENGGALFHDDDTSTLIYPLDLMKKAELILVVKDFIL